jgi:hypothetical protein
MIKALDCVSLSVERSELDVFIRHAPLLLNAVKVKEHQLLTRQMNRSVYWDLDKDMATQPNNTILDLAELVYL